MSGPGNAKREGRKTEKDPFIGNSLKHGSNGFAGS